MNSKPQTVQCSSKPVNDQDRVDEAIAESFPASDPPSYTAGKKQASAEDATQLKRDTEDKSARKDDAKS